MSVVQENPAASQLADKKKNLIEKYVPSLWPYIRLMRGNNHCVIITYWPFTWGLLLAANVASFSPAYTLLYLALFAVSNFLWVGAAGAINDVWDVDYDKQVSGSLQISPHSSRRDIRAEAVMCFIAVQITCLVPTYHMNETCQKLLLLGVLPVAIYPCSKRLIGCPSFTFGLIVNWGLLIGWASVMNNVDPAVCGPLYFGAICWTVFYDTIYGAQDNKDDAIAGVKSTYLTFGPYTKILLALSAFGTIAGLTLAGVNAGMEWPYYVGLLVCSFQLGKQIFTVNLDDPEDCVRKYNEHSLFGLLVSLAMLAGAWNFFQGSALPASAWHEL